MERDEVLCCVEGALSLLLCVRKLEQVLLLHRCQEDYGEACGQGH